MEQLGSHWTDFHEYIIQQNALSAIKHKSLNTLRVKCQILMSRHQGATLREFDNNKVSHVQHARQVLVAVTFIIKIKNLRT